VPAAAAQNALYVAILRMQLAKATDAVDKEEWGQLLAFAEKGEGPVRCTG
jgi:hypothetical protein